ncbi:flagellar assembly protein FliW [Sutcliffiella sp. NC1]|uniref:flagellar assembly protein FliW n=1 Tax=Sutcliffiella sp. NC1 TaxID=3004096 RepID=UPI0022DE6813|nr:flagellar assembly protein FliW [Sutcliffiella sp. NC1]WBL14500.1 flagellar assembly protein FliW [Sutcliffiella sp. NC1]
MKINTCYHGDITIQESDIITFKNGLPGFENEKKFVLLSLTEENVYFSLQSVNTTDLAFIVTNPFLFYNDYEFELEESTQQALAISASQSVEIYVVLTIADPFEKSTANLQGPIVINKENQLAKQIVVNGTKYNTKHILPLSTKEEK